MLRLQVECSDVAAVSEDLAAVYVEQPRFGQAYNFSLFPIEKSVVEDLFQLFTLKLLNLSASFEVAASILSRIGSSQ